MGIDLWFKTRFVTKTPLIFKVHVLNFKSIKVARFAVKNPDFRFIRIRDAILKFSNSSPGRNFEANDIKFGSNKQLSKLLLKA